MRIGELGSATGVDVETIRYYEKAGLLAPPARRDNGYRSYGEAQLERLAFIRHCRALDMTLAEIRRLLEFVDQPSVECCDVNRLIEEQLERVRTRITSLRALERQLAALLGRCAVANTAADCGILQELVTAARHEARTNGTKARTRVGERRKAKPTLSGITRS